MLAHLARWAGVYWLLGLSKMLSRQRSTARPTSSRFSGPRVTSFTAQGDDGVQARRQTGRVVA